MPRGHVPLISIDYSSSRQAESNAVCRFNVYVAQPEVKPGCVLRRSNVRELESRNLVDSKEVPP